MSTLYSWTAIFLFAQPRPKYNDWGQHDDIRGSQNVGDLPGSWVHNKCWPLWWLIFFVDKSRDNVKPHSICFLPQYPRQRKCLFQSARAEKGISWQVDASSVVVTLIDNGKLANQIARLLAIVLKLQFPLFCSQLNCRSLSMIRLFSLEI